MPKRAASQFRDSLAHGLAAQEPAERERVLKAGDALIATRRALLAKPQGRAVARAATRDRIRVAG
jgi:hypothetical protein